MTRGEAWSSLVEGDEGSYLPNCQMNFVIALNTLSLLFCKFKNTTAYHLGRYKPPVSCRAHPVRHSIVFLGGVVLGVATQVDLTHTFIMFFDGLTPASFCLLSFFLIQFYRKNCRLQRDLKSDHQNRRRAR